MNLEKHNFEHREFVAEKIKEAAILYNGEIFSGISHGHAIANLQDKYPNINYDEIEASDMDGFITTKGRFVDRKEAAEIAKFNRQIRQDKNHRNKKHLFTEDMEG